MRNTKVKFRGGRTFTRRIPKHSPYELQLIRQLSAPQLKKRSRSRAANKQARLARRVTRHGR